ncbi:ATP-grasp domain-containing protein [bacterium]|nr:ATP-grasp domain-containing protein [bacterium]
MSIRVLVTGANSTVAQSIIKALKASPLDVAIAACDINPYSAGLYRGHQAFLVKPYTDPGYEAQMLELLKTQRVDVLLPGVEGELQLLAERRARWEAETGCRIIVNSRSLLDITQDKYLTARFLRANGCSAPESTIETDPASLAAFIARVGFPLIVKPRRGATSRHVHLVHDEAELRACLEQVPGPVIQEYLDSEEYTCGVFVDAEGTLKGVATMQRMMANGITGTAIAGSFPDVEAEVRRVVQALGLRASGNIQMRRNRSGRPTTFEVNARFSSSVAIRAHFGFNEAEATLRSFYLGEPVPELRCRPGIAMRYVNEIYAEASEIQALLADGAHRPASVVEANF